MPPEVDLATLDPDEAHIARAAVASHRRNRHRMQAQAAFFEAVAARYHERPNALRLSPTDDCAPVMVFGSGSGQVVEPMPDDLADLYRAWKSA
jgi:hypothetical protein